VRLGSSSSASSEIHGTACVSRSAVASCSSAVSLRARHAEPGQWRDATDLELGNGPQRAIVARPPSAVRRPTTPAGW
jgi:hypothetical protein